MSLTVEQVGAYMWNGFELRLLVITPFVFAFGMALVAPQVLSYPRLGKWIERGVVLLPLMMTGVLLSAFSLIHSGGTLRESVSWVPFLGVNLSFCLDGLSFVFALIVTIVGSAVFSYVPAYLKEQKNRFRLYLFLLAFMGAMLGLVLSDNLIGLFLFWELTSLCSFFLIGFDHTHSEVQESALQALLVTGGTGFFLLVGFLLLGHAADSWEISQILEQNKNLDHLPMKNSIMIFILIGALAKSAQFPFHFWLPRAMVAPAPVSAYLHSATLVKAGIYLMARFFPLFSELPLWGMILCGSGGMSFLWACPMAFRQTDMKLVLAYMTIAVLGLLSFLLGLGGFVGSGPLTAFLVYLMVHSFYKAALFMATGTIDHLTQSRDLLALRGLRHSLPFTALVVFLAALSMAGLPPFLGFLGKELILTAAWETKDFFGVGGVVLMGIFLLGLGLVVGCAFLVSWGPFMGPRPKPRLVSYVDQKPALWLGPMGLGVLSLFLGLFPSVLFSPLLAQALETLSPDGANLKLKIWHGLNWPLALGIGTLLLGIFFYRARLYLRECLAKHFLFGKGPGPEALYAFLLRHLREDSKTMAAFFQRGDLRFYLGHSLGIGFLSVLIYWGVHWDFIWEEGLPALKESFQFSLVQGNNLYEWILIFIMVLGSLNALTVTGPIGAVISMGLVGLGLSLVYLNYGAPDLALTQFLVETLVAILVSFFFIHFPRKLLHFTFQKVRFYGFLMAIFGGVTASLAALSVVGQKKFPSIGSYFVENSYKLAFGTNAVNTILVDFRAIDTLGEVSVLSLVGPGVYILLRGRGKNKKGLS